MPSFDKLIFARWIVTVEKDSEILENHAIAIQAGKIVGILPETEARNIQANSIVELNQHIVLPGFINLHSHAPMALFRGLADDLPLMDWLNNYIWPAESKHVAEDFVFDGTLLAMSEMLRSGITTVNDMYFYHEALARASIAAGMRTTVGCTILDFPTNYAQNADEYISKALAARSEFIGEPRINFSLAPHAPYTVSDETFRKVISIAEQEDLLIHCHIHETAIEINDSQNKTHQRPLTRLNNLGLLCPRLIAAHMVHLSEKEIELIKLNKVSIAHNPSSNMKLASGIAPISALLDSEVNVGIGTDGAASNNKLDMLSETRLTSLLAKVSSADPTCISAATALRMATLNGAQALGIADKTGSIKCGKQADIIAINIEQIETIPIFDPISHIVYAAGREQVTHVWVDGECLMQNRILTKLDIAEVITRAKNWQTRIMESI